MPPALSLGCPSGASSTDHSMVVTATSSVRTFWHIRRRPVFAAQGYIFLRTATLVASARRSCSSALAALSNMRTVLDPFN
jgi:hypothetical protein